MFDLHANVCFALVNCNINLKVVAGAVAARGGEGRN